MSHPFGDLLSQHLHRKHGLSQAKLAAGILQDPSIIGKMCKGRRLNGAQARERVLAIIGWLRQQTALTTVSEANQLLAAAGMAALHESKPDETVLLRQLDTQTNLSRSQSTQSRVTHLVRKTNLPALLTSFVGRTQELHEVAQLVADHRLVTLTGAGGVGKTRLALEVAKSLVEIEQSVTTTAFPDGIWFIELAVLEEGALSTTLVAEAIGRLFKTPAQASRMTLEGLLEFLADKALLLVVDNCEHLVAACAEICERLLHHCWHLHILATSREDLRIPGEVVYPVLPLTLPSPTESTSNAVLASTAAQLFVERMRATSPTSKIVKSEIAALARICHQLDGIPLALELAAPLTRSLSLAEIAAQLDNQMALLTNSYRTAIPRHQTMHSALIWSYRLLSPEEQSLLTRAAVFAGGWTLAAAQAVCMDSASPNVNPVNIISPANIATLLNQLIAKSLVLTETLNDQRRYRLLEPVRQFAYTQLVASGFYEPQELIRQSAAAKQDEANQSTTNNVTMVRHRHLHYYMALAEEIEPDLRVGRQVAARYAQLDAEHDNLRSAINWALSSGEFECGVRIVGALYHFWVARGYLREGQAQAERFLAHSTAIPAADHARALLTAGGLAANQHNYHTAEPLLAESAAIARELDAAGRLTLARTCIELSWTMVAFLDFAAAQRYGQEALALGQELDDPWVRGQALLVLGAVASDQGNYLTARQHFDAALACCQPLRGTLIYGSTLSSLGMLLCSQGDYQAAHTYLTQSVAIFDALGDQSEKAWGLLGLGDIAAAQNKLTEAEQYYDQALRIQREFNDIDHAGNTLAAMGRLAQRQGDHERSSALLHESLTMTIKMGYQPTIVDALEAWASLTAAQGDAERSVLLFGAVDELLRKDNLLLKPIHQPLHNRQLSALRDKLGAVAFTTAWAAGAAMTLEEVTALILHG